MSLSTRHPLLRALLPLLLFGLAACNGSGNLAQDFDEHYDFDYTPPHAYESPDDLNETYFLTDEEGEPHYDYDSYERYFPEYDEDDHLPGYISEEKRDPSGENLEYTTTRPLDPSEAPDRYRPDEETVDVDPHYSYGPQED